MRSYWIWLGPKSNEIVPVRDGEEHTQTQRKGDHVKTEAEPGVVQPQAKGCQEPPEAGRGQEEFLPQALVSFPPAGQALPQWGDLGQEQGSPSTLGVGVRGVLRSAHLLHLLHQPLAPPSSSCEQGLPSPASALTPASSIAACPPLWPLLNRALEPQARSKCKRIQNL